MIIFKEMIGEEVGDGINVIISRLAPVAGE